MRKTCFSQIIATAGLLIAANSQMALSQDAYPSRFVRMPIALVPAASLVS